MTKKWFKEKGCRYGNFS